MTPPRKLAGRAFGSQDRQRRDPRAGGAAELCVGDDQQELVDAFARDLLQPQVLHDHHAVADVERLRDDERLVRVFRWVGAEAPGVTPGQRHPVSGEPLAERQARAGLARGVALVVGAPQTAPAGVEEHRIAGPDIQPRSRKSCLCVRHRDHIAWFEPLAATSSSRPRVTTCGSLSMPSRFVPWSSTMSQRANPLYVRSPTCRWLSPSMCVPICWVAVTCSTIQLTLLRPRPAGPASPRRRLIWW